MTFWSAVAPTLSSAVKVLAPALATGSCRLHVPSLAMGALKAPIRTTEAPGEVSTPLTVSLRLVGVLSSGRGWGEKYRPSVRAIMELAAGLVIFRPVALSARSQESRGDPSPL